MGRLGAVAVPLLAVFLSGTVAGVALALGGYDPGTAGRALMSGSLGSVDAVLSVTLVRTVPLLLTGLAVALAFRAGIWNIGAEGQLYAGAVAAVVVGLRLDIQSAWVVAPTALVAAFVAGGVWALLPALMRRRLGVGEVITTLLMNFLAIHLAGWLVHGPLQEARGVFPQTEAISEAARLPVVVPGSRLHLGFLLAVGLAVATWAFLRFTAAGFAVRAMGASPAAARTAGRIDTSRLGVAVFLTSGAVAGLAGGVEVTGVTFALYENLSPGWGYTAIAVALLAGLHPLAVVLTALFFGALEGGAGAMQRDAGIPAAWVSAAEALTILSVLAVDRAWRATARRRTAHA